jgi:hypothetical protein
LQSFADAVITRGYIRHPLHRRDVVAQVMRVSPLDLEMDVQVDPDTLNADFRVDVTRPDLGVPQTRPRPGVHLATVLRRLVRDGRPAIVFNGNNVGWWGNQFVIRNRQLVYKRRGPLFGDDWWWLNVHGRRFPFFVPTPSGFEIKKFTLYAQPSSTTAGEIELHTEEPLPEFGVSGFPLVQKGQAVWERSASQAWDAGLLYALPKRHDTRWWQIQRDSEALRKIGAPLVRHAMTVIGVDWSGRVVLLVVEKSYRSVGMTVAEVADLLIRQLDVTDAIVLGAAGDAQLATTDEGFLTTPLVEKHARPASRRIPWKLIARDLKAWRPGLRAWRRGLKAWLMRARPVPCYVVLRPSAAGSVLRTWFPPLTPGVA